MCWPARWERRELEDGRELIIDVAHNAECSVALDAMLSAHIEKTGTRPSLIVGVLGTDRAQPILRVIAKHAGRIFLVRPAQDRACSLADLRACIPADFSGNIFESDVATLFPGKGRCALETQPGESLIVAGSCYLAGEVIAALAGNAADSEQNLQDKLPSAKP